MTAEKILGVLDEKKIAYSIVSLQPDIPIEKVIVEPKDIGLYHEGTICICGPDYYDAIRGRYSNILYFLIDVPKGKKLLPAANMVIIESKIAAREIFQMVDTFIHRSYRIDNAYAQVGQYILSGKSVEALLGIGSRLLKNPIALLDISTKAICYSDIEVFREMDDELIRSVVENGFVSAGLFAKYDYETLLPFIGAMERSQIFRSKHKEKKNRINSRVMVNHKYFGMLVIPEIWTELDEDDTQIADIIANGVSILLEKQQVTTVNNNMESIFLELLSDAFADEEEFLKRAGGFGWKPEGMIRIVAIRTRNDKQSQSLLSYRNHLGLILPQTVSCYYEETMYLLIEEKDSAYIENTLSTFLQTNHLVAGTSVQFADSLSIARYGRQALDILRIGKYLRPQDHVFRFEQYMQHYNAYILRQNGCEEAFLLPELRAACEYDTEYDTEYCASVRVWLNYRNLVQAAKALNIHRNTMVYRLEKFESITGLQLAEGDAIYRLNTAFHLWDLREFPYTGKHS